MSDHERIGKEQEVVSSSWVIVFDDDSDWHDIVKKDVGNYCVLGFTTFEEANTFLDEQVALMDEEALLVGAFVVDGNLTENGAEGDKIITRIREIPRYNQIPIISNSGSSRLAGSDYDLRKDENNQSVELLAWINAGRPIKS